MTLTLTSADQHRVAEAIRALASPTAAGSVDAWRSEAASLAREAVGVDSAALVIPHAAGFDLELTAGGGRHAETYERYFPLLVEAGVVERGARIGVGTRRTLYGPHYDRLMRSEYVQGFLRSIDSSDAVFIFAPLAPRVREMGDAAQLTLSVGRGRSVHERHEAIARLLRPAFAAGLSTYAAFKGLRGQFHAAIDASGAPCLVMDRSGAVVHRTPTFEALLALDPERESLVALAAQVARTFWTDAPCAAATYQGTAAAYHLTASEIWDGGAAFCVVQAKRIQRRMPSLVTVADTHGLTPRQSEVGLLLAERRTNKEIAVALSISVHTARHHVEAVLGHLGVDRRGVSAKLGLARARGSES